MPAALARHLERLKALPSNGGESPEGPGSAAEAAFLQRAFPDADIPADRIQSARDSHGFHREKGFPRGEDRRGRWSKIGPSDAVYPFFALRTSAIYVPNEYVAGGRTTSLALAGECEPGECTLYAGPAGGGIWRTKDALAQHPHWKYLSTPFEINSIGSIAVDPNDHTGKTIWVGTGEANACSSGCEAGVGLYKSTDGGDTWIGPLGQPVFNARGVGTIAIKPGDPNTVYAASTRAIRGASSSCCGGAVSIIPGAAKWGLYRSTDGGASWTFIHNGAATTAGCTGDATEAGNGTPCSPRGVRRVLFDPSNPNILYAGSYARGVWRSSDGGTTWTAIKASLSPGTTTTRPELAVTTLPNGKTRMYVAEGASGAPFSQLFRSDDVATGVPSFASLTSANPADSGFGSFNYCGGQCWYDNFVVTPAGYPDTVYLGGSYQYGETGGISNGRGVVLSTDAGVSFTDMTMDATDPVHPNGIHPDQHFLVVNPNNPSQFFESGDGGIVRASGEFADVSSNCLPRGLSGPALSRCQQLLSRVPTRIESVNRGLSTLQFQSVSYNPFDVDDVQGGTQDNGTWETDGNHVKWTETMVGDGGQSGFDVADRHFRFHTFAGQGADVNFNDGAVGDWNWIGDPLFNGEAAEFYVPIISDPKVSGTMFTGTSHVWRTKTHGLGSMTLDVLRLHCNEWTGDFAVTCGDWQPLGDPGSAGRLTAASFGDRAGGDLAAVQRAPGDTSTLWAATSRGRVFISKNADGEPAAAVTFSRIDVSSSPGRYVTGIHIKANNPNHAWISYSGFNASTPSTPGHVFEVVYDPLSGTATWTDRSYDLGDMPITAVVRDDANGDLYAASDFGVVLLDDGATSWTQAAPGMPNVEVAGLTIVPSGRRLYAASHGLSAWSLRLREDEDN
ncbi:MAG TPA: sialidase family protein [Vicinamibacteria bacterium]|nr:sialidase family protein [Vicinamibacteria bacterium]